jgi:hypothetical protein
LIVLGLDKGTWNDKMPINKTKYLERKEILIANEKWMKTLPKLKKCIEVR